MRKKSTFLQAIQNVIKLKLNTIFILSGNVLNIKANKPNYTAENLFKTLADLGYTNKLANKNRKVVRLYSEEAVVEVDLQSHTIIDLTFYIAYIRQVLIELSVRFEDVENKACAGRALKIDRLTFKAILSFIDTDGVMLSIYDVDGTVLEAVHDDKITLLCKPVKRDDIVYIEI